MIRAAVCGLVASLSIVAVAASGAAKPAAPARPAAPTRPAAPPAAPAAVVPPAAAAAPNTLTPAERAAGWKLLFDGATVDGWRGYKQATFPAAKPGGGGWTISDGALCTSPGGSGGDIITAEQFGDFELSLEYRTSPKANSGIIFRVAEKHDTSWMTGPEFQVIDDGGNDLKPDDAHSSGALYDLAAPAAGKVVKPAGEWNHARIVLRDGRLRHYLNGVRIVDLRIDGKDWIERINGSKFKVYEGFGLQPRGHIALQDHGDAVCYRNIKIRSFDAPMPGEVQLFNGKDTTGWTAFLQDGKGMADVWSVKDGVLRCAGRPIGYIRTTADHANYVLKLEWRWPIGPSGSGDPGNSGVLLRMVGEDKVWPKSVEAQLQSGSAGDFWNIDEVQMKVDPARTNGRNTKQTHANENAIGEWNEYEIIVDGGDIRLNVNGEELNHAWDVAVVPGKICLQSEGAPIEFRNIRLAPIVADPKPEGARPGAGTIGLSTPAAGAAAPVGDGSDKAAMVKAGAEEARADIGRGVLKLRTFGLPAVWAGDYHELLRTRLGVEIEGVAGCIVDERIVETTKGYNEVMRTEIARRFGAKALDQVQVDAERQWNAQFEQVASGGAAKGAKGAKGK
ncbi:MAG: DUF1080 domain-containing protein [Phycisphaerales bacterium]